jgi:hypothetical protein
MDSYRGTVFVRFRGHGCFWVDYEVASRYVFHISAIQPTVICNVGGNILMVIVMNC